MKKYQINAADKILGRVAAEVAVLLRGKNTPNFLPYKEDVGNIVEVVNAVKIRVSGKKMQQKMYWRYSGYPGGIKKITLEKLMQKDAGMVLRHAVYGMLPKNKLRAKMLKRLFIKK